MRWLERRRGVRQFLVRLRTLARWAARPWATGPLTPDRPAIELRAAGTAFLALGFPGLGLRAALLQNSAGPVAELVVGLTAAWLEQEERPAFHSDSSRAPVAPTQKSRTSSPARENQRQSPGPQFSSAWNPSISP